MMDWIATNSAALSVIMAAITALVWVVYLQMLFLQLRRNRRPVILISRSAGRDCKARLFVSNMGAEPIYIISLIASLECDDLEATAIITDNDDISADEDKGPSTNEGPLGSGEYMDAGDFGSLMQRVSDHARPRIDTGDIKRMTLTVVASTGYSVAIVGGMRSFRIHYEDGKTVFDPEHLDTRQLRGPLARRRLRAQLKQHLRDHAF